MDLSKPENADAMLYEIWFAIKGANGDGLWSRVKKMEERQDKYFSEERKKTCYYLSDKEEGRSRHAKILDMVKFAISEGVKIGAALGIFTWLRGQL